MDNSNTFHQFNTGHPSLVPNPEELTPATATFLPTFPDHGVITRNLVPAHQEEQENFNNPAVIVGNRFGTVYEFDDSEWYYDDQSPVMSVAIFIGDDSTASGTLTVIDPDPGENVFQSPGSLQGQYGDFTFNRFTGAWTYQLNDGNPAVDALNDGQELHDYLQVQSLDGSASALINITIVGVTDNYISMG
jgi:VCBS repeat-containing protein